MAEVIRNSFTLRGANMKRIYASLWIFVCLFAVTARAQDGGLAAAQKNIVFDVKIVDIDAQTSEAMEAIASNQNRLNQMLSEGKAKLIAGTKVSALLNAKTSMRTGQRVPVQSATFPTFQSPRNNNANSQIPPQGSGVPQPAAGIPHIQYENTGLSLDFESRLKPDGLIDLIFRIEMTTLSSHTGNLTPTFITRILTSSIKIKQNQPPIILEMFQNEFPVQSSAQASPANPLRSNFFILLSAKVVD
jgi:type II secretory pathway component GspD/PulD (secretin)